MLDLIDCLAAAEPDSSKLAGQCIAIGLVIMGLVRSLNTFRKPGTSRLCVLALIFLLTVWLINGIYGVSVSGSAAPNLWIVIPFLTVSVLGVLSAIVLAIIGLVQYAPRERHERGSGHAKWALALSFLWLIGFGFGVFSQARKSWSTGVESSTSAAEVVFVEENFAVRPVSGDWVRSGDSEAKTGNTAVWMNSRADMGLAIESSPMAALNECSELTEGMLKNMVQDPKFSNPSAIHEVTIAGRVWRTWTIDAVLPGSNLKVVYCYRVFASGGQFYSFYSWGRRGRGEQISQVLDRWLESFRLINPTPVTKNGFKDVDSPATGFRTQLGPLGWNSFDYSPKAFPSASFKSIRGGTCVITGYTWCFAKGVVPDTEAVNAAMFSGLGEAYPIEDAKRQEIVVDGVPVREFTWNHNGSDGNFEKILRITSDAESARLVYGYFEISTDEEENSRRRKTTRDAFDAVHFIPVKVETMPEDWAQRWGFFNNDAGLSYHTRQDWKSAHDFFKASLEIHDDPAVAGNLIDSLEKLGDLQEAGKVADHWVEVFPKSAQLANWQGVLREDAGTPEPAIESFQRAIELGLKDDEVKSKLLGLLLDVGRNDEAIAKADAYFKDSSTPKRARWRSAVYARAGQVEKAVSQLRERLASPPLEAESAYQLAELFNQEGRFAETEEVLKQLRSAGQDSSRGLMIEGWSYMGRKWYPRAKLAFEKALEKSPGDPEVKSALAEAASSMGQGGREGADKVIAPVEIPSEFATQTAPATKVPSQAADQDACYLQSVMAVHWEPDQRLVKTLTQQIRILGPSALEDFNTLSFSFSGGAERIWMNRVEVLSPDGSKRVAVKPVETWVKDLQSDGLATSNRGFYIPVPGLEVGSTIEIQVTWQDLGTESEMPWQEKFLAKTSSSAAECFVLTGAVDRVSSKVAGEGVREMKLPKARLWMVSEPPLIHMEPSLPDFDEISPLVSVSAKGRDWKTLGKTYLGELEPLFKVDDSVAAKAKAVAEPLGTTREKVAAIARQIQKDITYRGIEFGTRARIPSECTRILSERSGDCKDHALLLVQMLRACRIPAQLVLVRTSRSVVSELPDLDQFDHMIAYIPGHLPSPWFDLTDKTLAPGEQTPSALAGRSVLVLDDQGSRLMTLPDQDPVNGWVDSARTIRYAEDGSATVEETLKLKGVTASWLRAAFQSGSPKEFPKIAQGYLQGVSAMKSCEVMDLDDVRAPLGLRLVYTIPAAARTVEKSVTAKIPSAWENCLLFLSPSAERHHPWQLRYGIDFRSEVTILPPPGSTAAPVVPKDSAQKDEHGEWSLGWKKAEAGAVKLKFQFKGVSGKGASSTYKDLYQSWSSPLHSLDQSVVWPGTP